MPTTINKVPVVPEGYKDKSTAKKVKITPKMAHHWLAKHNENNRPTREHIAEKYAELMKDGKWHTNSATIAFDFNGNLIDGQHRLEAIFQSGETIESWVIEGLHPGTFRTVDIGSKRTIADMLAIRGETNRHSLAAALSLYYSYLQNDLSNFKQGKGSGSYEEIEELLDNHIRIRESIGFVAKYQKEGLLFNSVLSFFHYAFSEIDELKANTFITRLYDLQGYDEKSPIRALRLKLEHVAKGKKSGSRPDKVSQMAYVIKAWNAFYKGEAMEKLEWDKYGKPPEPFPTIAGRENVVSEELAQAA